MWRIYQAMKDRMAQYLLAESNLTANAHQGSDIITVEYTSDFNAEGINNSYPQCILVDKNTTGIQIPGGLEGTEVVEIDTIDNSNISLRSNLSNNWLVSNNARLKRAPNGVPIDDVIIGDLAVIPKFPVVCVIPVSKSIQWKTFSGTMETVGIDFMVYSVDDDTENAQISLLKVTDVVEWILMSKLHIHPFGFTLDREVTSNAIVSSIDYGTIAKGSTFLKAAKLTWTADLYFWRGYLTSQGVGESPLPGPLASR